MEKARTFESTMNDLTHNVKLLGAGLRTDISSANTIEAVNGMIDLTLTIYERLLDIQDDVIEAMNKKISSVRHSLDNNGDLDFISAELKDAELARNLRELISQTLEPTKVALDAWMSRKERLRMYIA